MLMYEVRPKDGRFPHSTFHRTVEEAQERIAHSKGGRRNDEGDVVEVQGREWLEIVTIERESQPCKVCGAESENSPDKYPGYPYCRNCHYTGSAAEDQRMNQLCDFRVALGDKCEVGIWHTGGGCFWLAFTYDGEPDYYIATDGEASLPDTPRDGWGYVGRQPHDEDSEEYDGVMLAAQIDHGGELEEYMTDLEVVGWILKDRRERGLEV